jgi:putative inorganic carbon (HCO3(-)) transporter
MFSDILWTFIIILFIILGIRRPYIALSGVVFVDILKPQTLSFSFLAGKPVSLIMTAILLISICLNYKEVQRPKKLFPIFLIMLFMIWTTITTYKAEFQAAAWFKHDYVFKTILFSLFIPFILNSRIKLDTFIAILVCSISFYTVALGMTTVAGGGGYGKALFHANTSNTGMTESSTMAMVAVINIPFIIYLANYSVFKEKISHINLTSKLLIFSSAMSVVGTAARTGLIGLFALVALRIGRSKYKLRFVLLILVTFMLALPFAPQNWLDRMSTIKSASGDSSAYGRIVVWRWTIDYVSDRPIFGGGFQSYLANAGQLNKYIMEETSISHTQTGKAFHNIYFEVLGEHGYVGLIQYLLMIWLVFKFTSRLKKKGHQSSDAWIGQASVALQDALIIYCVCGMFIGVAYYPWLYYFLALSVCLFHIDNQRGKELERSSCDSSGSYKQ